MIKSMFPLLGMHVYLKTDKCVCVCVSAQFYWTLQPRGPLWAHRAPLSMGFPWQEYWSGLPFPSPGDLPQLGIKPISPALAGEFFIPSHQGNHLLPYSFVNFFTAENLTIFACHCIPGAKHWALHRVNIQKMFMKDWVYVIFILILQINVETQESKCLCSYLLHNQ